MALTILQPLKHSSQTQCVQARVTCQCSGLPFFLTKSSLTRSHHPRDLCSTLYYKSESSDNLIHNAFYPKLTNDDNQLTGLLNTWIPTPQSIPSKSDSPGASLPICSLIKHAHVNLIILQVWDPLISGSQP